MASRPIPYPGALSESAAAALRPGILFESASRAAATYTTGEMANLRGEGVELIIDITNVGAGPGTVTLTVQVFDPGSNAWVALPGAVSATLNATGTTVITIKPGLDVSANVSIPRQVPPRWRLSVVVAVNAVTFSIAGFYV